MSEAETYAILAESGAAAEDHGLVLACGDTFAVFDRHGALRPGRGSPHGLYVDGTRFLSALTLSFGPRAPLWLCSGSGGAHDGFFVHETNPDLRPAGGAPLERDLVHLLRRVTLADAACRIELELCSYASEPIRLPLVLRYAADFADVFEVRGARRARRGLLQRPRVADGGVELAYLGLDGVERRTRLRLSGAEAHLGEHTVALALTLEPRKPLALDLAVDCELRAGGERVRQGFAAGGASLRSPGEGPEIATSNPAVDAWIRRSLADLDLLAAATGHGPFPYAGVPWYCTPFGRDALVTAYELLWLDPRLARSVLRFLSAHQATEPDPARDADVGKIVHELRAGEMARLGEVPFGRYYGSVDATPLFGLLAAAYHARSADDAFLEALWPSLELALAWVEGPGDPDGDGLVEYARRSPRGLVNQGWKDSHDAVMHADGSLAAGPVALCEVQSYVFGMKQGLARVARRLGRARRAEQLEDGAERLRRRFADTFWCDDLGAFALALDGGKRPCRVPSSNSGHALLSGIATPEQARAVARTLLASDHFSGWGVRTLAESAARYNPMSYHNGSVWPHDNALVALGFARYGETAAAARLFGGLFDAWLALEEQRLPELLCGFARRPGEPPTRYPVACSPQAWSAGAVSLLVQASLGIEVDACAREVRVSRPELPAALDHVEIRDLDVAGATLDLRLERRGAEIRLDVLRNPGALRVRFAGESAAARAER